jgi:hypothetical protein
MEFKSEVAPDIGVECQRCGKTDKAKTRTQNRTAADYRARDYTSVPEVSPRSHTTKHSSRHPNLVSGMVKTSRQTLSGQPLGSSEVFAGMSLATIV